MSTTIGSQKFITLRDMNNDKLIGSYNVTNVEGSIMDYYYYYFVGYENYIEHLLKRGAILHDNEVPESHPHNKLVTIYEIPLVKVNINEEAVNSAMKGKDLIKLIIDNNLEDHEVSVIFEDGFNVYPVFKTAKLTGLGDIGHSERVIYLESELDD